MLYADIFHYPLTASEIYQNNIGSDPVTESDIRESLRSLCELGLVRQKGFFYSLRNENDIYEERVKKNQLALKYKKRGLRISRFIGNFPFVRGVFLSGSISKDCMAEDGDIDYFIITAPKRLWIARTLLILFKKIFLLNSYKLFCLNYFVDIRYLEIEEKNIYTATEIVTLVPTYGYEACDAFLRNNTWASGFRPHFPPRSMENIRSSQPSFFKKSVEWFLGGKVGNALEKFFLQVTSRFWQRKFRDFSTKDYNLSIKSREHLSQINPENFQKRVLLAYEEKVRAFEKEHAFPLN